MRAYHTHAVAFWVGEGETAVATLLFVTRRIALDPGGSEPTVERIHIVCGEVELSARRLTGEKEDVSFPNFEDRDDAGAQNRLPQTDRLAIERGKAINIACAEADVAHRDDPACHGHTFSISSSPLVPLSSPFHEWPRPTRPLATFVARASSAMKSP